MDQYNSKSTNSLVCGILSIVGSVVGLFWMSVNVFIFGIVGITSVFCAVVGLIVGIQIRKAGQLEGFKPSGTATAGFVLSIIGLILYSVLSSCVYCVFIFGL